MAEDDPLEGYRGHRVSEDDLSSEEEVMARLVQERGPDSEDVALFRKVQLKSNVEDWIQGRANPQTCARVAKLICQKADEELDQLEQQWSMNPDPTSPEMRDAHLRAHALRAMLGYLNETIEEGREAERTLREDEEAYHE